MAIDPDKEEIEDRDIDSDLRIDEMSLNKEWALQPRTYRAWSKISAQAKRIAEIRKGDLEETRAEVAKDIRSSSQTKLSEKALEAEVLLDDRYKKALRRSIDSKYESDVLAGAVKAMEQRKDSLEWISKLFLANYYAEPEHSGDSRIIVEHLDKEDVKQKVRLALNKRRKE